MPKPIKRAIVSHFLPRKWWVVTHSWAPLAGPYSNERSARYIAKRINEVLENEPCAGCD